MDAMAGGIHSNFPDIRQ